MADAGESSQLTYTLFHSACWLLFEGSMSEPAVLPSMVNEAGDHSAPGPDAYGVGTTALTWFE